MKKIICTLLISLCFVFAFAGNHNNESKSNETSTVNNIEHVNLSGTIVDLVNGETLAGVTILVDGKKYYSDLDGNFNIPLLNPGKYSFLVELISYNNTKMEVEVQKNTNLKIQLARK